MASPTNTQLIESALADPSNHVPADITLAFLQKSKDQGAIIAILFITSFVLVVVAVRSFARCVSTRGFGLDDWLAATALVSSVQDDTLKRRYWQVAQASLIAFSVLAVILIHLGSGRHFAYIQYVLDDAIVRRTEVLDFWAHLVYTASLLICRLSGLAFFARIADRQRKLTWAIRITAATMTALWLPQMALIIFHCDPVTALWPYAFEANAEKFECLQWGVVYVTNSAISLFCDLALFTIPAVIIKELKIDTRDKLKLASIMMPGLLVIGLSSVRMYLVIVGQWEVSFPVKVELTMWILTWVGFDIQPDQSWSYNGLLTIEVAEIGSTLVALSVPALKPFFGKFFTFLDTTFITNASSRTGSKRGSKRESGFGLVNWRKREDGAQSEPSEIAVRHSLAVTNERGFHKWSNSNSSHTAVVSAGGHSIRSGRSDEQLDYWANSSASQR
jgi:hypothetical protein